MHSGSLRFWNNGCSSSVPGVPRLLLIVVFLLASGRRFANWFLAPLRTFGILEQDFHPYLPHDPLTLWPITPFNSNSTHNSSFTYNSQLIFSSSSSLVDNPPQTIREKLPAVVEYGSLGEDRQEDITCAVCLTDFRATDRIRRLAKCGHAFHMECLDKWIDYQRYTCPLCRSPTF